MELLMVIGKGALSGFLASLGFGVLFNIRGSHLFYAGLTGGLGTLVYSACLYLGYGEILACFAASIVYSLTAEILARWCKAPATIFLVCALIPLVPGGGMYRMMLAAIQGKVDLALKVGLNTLSIAGILVLGILIVSAAVQSLTRIGHVLSKEKKYDSIDR